MKRQWQFFFSMILIVIATAALAAKVDFLYQGQVPVTSQSQAEQNRALPLALLQVLAKVSGNSPLLKDAQITARLGDVKKLVQQVGYAKPNVLSVEFDPNGVNELLRNLKIPIWGQNRPLILAWVTLEVPQHSAEIINSDSSNEIVPLLKNTAERYGLPLLFPLMDMTDINQVSVHDISTMSLPVLTSAAKRYASDSLLIGRILQGPTGFTTQWRLVLNDNQWNWNFSGKSLNEIFPLLMENITNTLAARFAVVTSNAVQTELTLRITGITQQTDFAGLIHYLEHLTPVANVNVQRIAGNDVILNVSLRGTPQAFLQLLSLGKKLTLLNADQKVYQWNP